MCNNEVTDLYTQYVCFLGGSLLLLSTFRQYISFAILADLLLRKNDFVENSLGSPSIVSTFHYIS